MRAAVCLSPAVDLIASVAIGAVAVDALRHVAAPREMLLGSLPALFALHQFTEVFVWWSLEGRVSTDVGERLVWVYLTFALVVLPSFVPAAIALVEDHRRRRRWMWGVFGIGAATSLVMAWQLFDGEATATVETAHIQYDFGLRWPIAVVVGYLIATCAPLLLASWPSLRWYGLANVVGVMLVGGFAVGGLVSLWCFWAALSSVAIAVHLRRRRSLEAAGLPVSSASLSTPTVDV